MEIELTQEKDILTATPVGRIDSTTADEFLNAVQTKLSEGANGLRIDMSKVPFISSKGIRVLLVLHRQLENKGKMTLVHCGPSIVEVLRLSALLNYLHLEE